MTGGVRTVHYGRERGRAERPEYPPDAQIIHAESQRLSAGVPITQVHYFKHNAIHDGVVEVISGTGGSEGQEQNVPKVELNAIKVKLHRVEPSPNTRKSTEPHALPPPSPL